MIRALLLTLLLAVSTLGFAPSPAFRVGAFYFDFVKDFCDDSCLMAASRTEQTLGNFLLGKLRCQSVIASIGFYKILIFPWINMQITVPRICILEDLWLDVIIRSLTLIEFPSTAPSTTELGVSVKIDVGEGEPVESALRRFKREVNKSGHMMELRHRRYFENSQEKIKRKIKEARMRKRLERMQRRRNNQRT